MVLPEYACYLRNPTRHSEHNATPHRYFTFLKMDPKNISIVSHQCINMDPADLEADFEKFIPWASEATLGLVFGVYFTRKYLKLLGRF